MAPSLSLSNLAPLDGIRGICSVFVVVGHFLSYWTPVGGVTPEGKAAPLFGLEYLTPVSLFFVISGFTLVRVYDKQPLTAHEGTSYGEAVSSAPLQTFLEKRVFCRRRVGRLLPVYYAGLLIGIPMLLLYNDTAGLLVSALAEVFLVQSFILVGNEWNGPLWTVSAFVLCYGLFPYLLRAARRSSTRRILFSIALYTALPLAAMIANVLLNGVGAGIDVHVFGPARLPHFYVGVLYGVLSQRWAPQNPTRVAELCSAALFVVLAGCAVATELARPLATDAAMGVFAGYAYLAEFAFVPLHGLWVLALTSEGCTGVTRSVLVTKPMRLLGDISYALYATHWPVIGWCAFSVAGGISNKAVPQITANGIPGWFYFAPWAIPPVLAVCMVVATLLHRFLEAPARAAITNRGGKGSGKDSDDTAALSTAQDEGKEALLLAGAENGNAAATGTA
jgi:peptidoglycan/LPS O-acetylase OafA/YrhL